MLPILSNLESFRTLLMFSDWWVRLKSDESDVSMSSLSTPIPFPSRNWVIIQYCYSSCAHITNVMKNNLFQYNAMHTWSDLEHYSFWTFVMLQPAIAINTPGSAVSTWICTSCPVVSVAGYVWTVGTIRPVVTVTIARKDITEIRTNRSLIGRLAKVRAHTILLTLASAL